MTDDIEPDDVREGTRATSGARIRGRDEERAGQRGNAFFSGLFRAASVPGFILMVSASGFGALAEDVGLSLGQALLVMVVYFGLPAQVAIADQLARDASIWAGALAVALTGVRLLPMTVTLLPFLRGEPDSDCSAGETGTSRPGSPGVASGLLRVLAVHFVAVTAWIEGMRALPALPARLRVYHFLGIGIGLTSMTLVGTAAGFLVVGYVPPVIGAVLLFVSPAYFLLALLEGAHRFADYLAIVAGCVLGPFLFLLLPGLDLLMAGVVGGTFAYLCVRFGFFEHGSNDRASGTGTGVGDV